jgi:hypothetical protein
VILAGLTYVVFTVLATAGTYLAAAHFRGHRTAAVLAAACLVFFVTLGAGLVWLIGQR